MLKITINNKELEVEKDKTILQICDEIGIKIPRFCYHKHLSIAGNCRMCLVEIEGMPKLQISCATYPVDGMVVNTETERVKKAREAVLEFLLLNHPLDCPICDQGGECDLQEYTMEYGRNKSRFKEEKRKIKPYDLSKYIMFHPQQCIHCMRCVRFAKEIAGIEEIGAIGRGEDTLITAYLDKGINSELSGNMIDVCPVGALNSKPYAYKARCWELDKTNSIDITDGLGSNISIQTRDNQVFRILPIENDKINYCWLSDKARFAFLDWNKDRIKSPAVRKEFGLKEISWSDGLNVAVEKLKGAGRIGALVGDKVSVETGFILKELFAYLGSNNIECRIDGAKIDTSARENYLFNSRLEGVEKSDFCLLAGVNPREEAVMLNVRLRNRYLKGGFEVASTNDLGDLLYPVENLNTSLERIVEGKHPIVSKIKKAKKPMIIIGMEGLTEEGNFAYAKYIADNYMKRDNWDGFNVLHNVAGRVGALDLGLTAEGGVNEVINSSDVIYLLEADVEIPQDKFVIYQGAYNTKAAKRANLLLPSANYAEQNGTYVNTEGLKQQANKATEPPKYVKESWKILHELLIKAGKNTEYHNFKQIREKTDFINNMNKFEWLKG